MRPRAESGSRAPVDQILAFQLEEAMYAVIGAREIHRELLCDILLQAWPRIWVT
jgi:hypothetical protein